MCRWVPGEWRWSTLPAAIVRTGEVGLLADLEDGEEKILQGLSLLRGQERLAEDLPMLGLGRAAGPGRPDLVWEGERRG